MIKSDVRPAGVMARECRVPSLSRAVSIPVLTVFTIDLRSSIFFCGVRSSFWAFETYGSRVVLDILAGVSEMTEVEAEASCTVRSRNNKDD